MLNAQTGELAIGALRIAPGFTFDRLIESSLPYTPLVSNPPYGSCSLGRQQIGGRIFSIMLSFRDRTILSVSMAIDSEEFGTSWEEWSLEKEMARKEAHERWLIAQTGSASHDREWGTIRSVYDERAGGSMIVIGYREP